MDSELVSPVISIIEKKLADNPAILAAVKGIAEKVKTTGMKPEDCCILYRIKPKNLKHIYSLCPEVESYFQMLRIENKSELLKVLNDSAKTNQDAKIALTLLEKHFSEEYDPAVLRQRAKNDQGDPNNTITQIISFVRQIQPPSPINPSAGLPVKPVIEAEDIERRLDNALLVKPQ